MMDDLEQLLGQHSPGEPDKLLRKRVLGAVAEELARRPAANWASRAAWAVAALLLIGIGLNMWAYRADRERLARYFAPRPPQAVLDVADAVESVTDRRTRDLVQQQLEAAWQHHAVNAAPEEVERSQQL